MFAYISKLPEFSDRQKDALFSQYYERATEMIVDTCKSVKHKLIKQNYTFELFGYDFILDEDLNLVLIEVNTNPCLEESNNLLKHMVPRMLDDMLNLTLDPIFNSGDTKYKSCFKLPGSIFTCDQGGTGSHAGYADD